MKNSLNKKGHIGIVEKVQETSSNTGIIYMTLCAYAITILHECWMQDTPISHCVTW